jgi:SAM-dependent methyltransferase
MSQKKRVLNVGGNAADAPMPAQYAGFEVLRLDIDPKVKPDILADGRELARLAAGQFDAVYCSHNLEHYYRHEVPKVLAGFRHVLKEGGFAHIIVPDMEEVMRIAVGSGLDLEDMLYESPAGPIRVLDVIWGYSVEIERTGQDFFAHKTGFTPKSLVAAVQAAGFARYYHGKGPLEVRLVAFKGLPDDETKRLFGFPDA